MANDQHKALRDVERATRRYHEAREARDEAIVAASRAGASRRAVAAAAGLRSPGRVQAIIRAAGLAVLLVLALAPLAHGASLRVAPDEWPEVTCANGGQVEARARPFIGGRWELRYTAVSASLAGDDGGEWQVERHTHTYRARGEWAAQLVEHTDGRVVVRNIGERPVRFRYRCASAGHEGTPAL